MNVDLDGVSDEMWSAALKVDRLTKNLFGREAIITSALDGVHGEGSLHYSGNAMDFRTRDFTAYLKGLYRKETANALGPDFDVVLERTHLHIEYDPD